MDKDAVNKVVAAILANGMMSANQQSKDSDTYIRAYKGFLHDLTEIDKEAAKARAERQAEVYKKLGEN
ncbi:MAG: hypothetical protein K0Q54_2579 [Methylobacterium brachiatum]|jgi:hypothetical protein|nr:hypothetical protein [Methylobacterium brachiatum]